MDATWRNLDGAAQPAVKQAMPYQPYYQIGAIYHTRALSALQKGTNAADRCARRVIREWPLALAPLIVPPCMELGQRALDGRQRSQAIKCLDEAGRLADDLDEVSRSIDGLGRHEKQKSRNCSDAPRRCWPQINEGHRPLVFRIRQSPKFAPRSRR